LDTWLTSYAGDEWIKAASIMLIPLIDFQTDILYYTTSVFADELTSYAVLAFILLPNFLFVNKMLYSGKAGDADSQEGLKHAAIPNILPANKEWRKMAKWLMKDHCNFGDGGLDNIMKLLVYMLMRLFALIVLIIFYIFGVVFLILRVLFLVFWFCFGLLLFSTKTISINRVWNMWFTVWTGKKTYNLSSKELVELHWFKPIKFGEERTPINNVDQKFLNESIATEFVFESLPQLIIQGMNNTYAGQWGNAVSLFSFAFSGFLLTNSLYRYGYLHFWVGIQFSDIPPSMFGFKIDFERAPFNAKASHGRAYDPANDEKLNEFDTHPDRSDRIALKESELYIRAIVKAILDDINSCDDKEQLVKLETLCSMSSNKLLIDLVESMVISLNSLDQGGEKYNRMFDSFCILLSQNGILKPRGLKIIGRIFKVDVPYSPSLFSTFKEKLYGTKEFIVSKSASSLEHKESNVASSATAVSEPESRIIVGSLSLPEAVQK